MKSLVSAWVVISTFLVALGWVLSAWHRLNGPAYTFAVACIAAGLLVAFGRRLRRSRFNWRKMRALWRRRFRRPFPLLFLLLTTMVITGGFLHPPNNYDALSYRIPRMLSWLTAERWEWLHTMNSRQNTRAANYEWLTMPLLAVTKSDRAFFIVNVLSFILLPGLVFSTLRRLGVQPRVAESWMWILPSGYNFVLQAGGVSNDIVAVPFALAAVDFALRARESRRVGYAWLSILAAGLMTGVKGSNLPLLLPWMIAVAPSLRLLSERPLRSVGILAAGALVSFLPTAVLNYRFCGDWTGAILEVDPGTYTPIGLAIAVNAVQLVLQNVCPPMFPLASWWNARAFNSLPEGLQRVIARSNFGSRVFDLGELPVEDSAPLGFAVTMLLICSWAFVVVRNCKCAAGQPSRTHPALSPLTRLVAFSPWLSLGIYMAKMVVTAAGRLVTPYYILLCVAPLQLSGQERLVKQKAWRLTGVLVLATALGVVVLNPARPLFPASSVFKTLEAAYPSCTFIQRASRVYAVYATRYDALAPIRDLVPPNILRLGLAASVDYPEASLWRPYRRRIVVHVLPGDTLERLRSAQLEYVILPPDFASRFGISPEAWCNRLGAQIVAKATVAHLASQPPQVWQLARLQGASYPGKSATDRSPGRNPP